MPSSTSLIWSTRAICLCLLLQIAISWPLWQSQRFFPHLASIPLLDPLQGLALAVLLWALLTLLFFPQRRVLFLLLSLSLGILLLTDLTRLQVWIYHLGGLLLILALNKDQESDQTIAKLRWIFPLIYIWGGLHKINPYYEDISFSWLISAFDWTQSLAEYSWFAKGSILLEVVIGIGLYFQATRKVAVLLGIGLHLSLLSLLGPWGHNWNRVVWPWNLLMIFLLYAWFWEEKNGANRWKALKSWPVLLFLLLWGLIPATNRWGLGDDALSFKMYAGDHPEASLYSAPDDTNCFPSSVDTKLFYIDSLAIRRRYLQIGSWAIKELGATAYNSPAALQAVALHYCECLDKPNLGGIDIMEIQGWQREIVERSFSCAELRRRKAR